MNKLLSAEGLFMDELNTYAETGKNAGWIKVAVMNVSRYDSGEENRWKNATRMNPNIGRVTLPSLQKVEELEYKGLMDSKDKNERK